MENGRGSEEHVTAICHTVFDAIVIIIIYITWIYLILVLSKLSLACAPGFFFFFSKNLSEMLEETNYNINFQFSLQLSGNTCIL